METARQRLSLQTWPLVLYGLTGFTGLLAEQCFEKYLSLLVGASVAASAAVIFTYFLGFSLGGVLIGLLMRRNCVRRPLVWYGVLELVVGICCVAFTYFFHPLSEVLGPWQQFAASPGGKMLLRFLLGCTFLLVPAALMGTSFPLLAQVVDKSDLSGGARWAQVYGINLLGAIAATLVAPYFIFPFIGPRGAMWLCLGVTAFVFAAAVLIDRRLRVELPAPLPETGAAELPSRAKVPGQWLLLAAAFASGLIFFALEVLWTHLIGVAIGTSTYAFSSMLLMVLTGMFIGAVLVKRKLDVKAAWRYSGPFQFAALIIVFQYRCWDVLQGAFNWSPPELLQSFWFAELWKLSIAALLIVPAAAVLGTIFPSLLGSPVLRSGRGAWLVGYLNAANSVGCLAGAVLGLYFFIPVVGSELSLKLIVVILAILALLFLRREQVARKQFVKAMLGLVLVLAYAGWWKWDLRLLTSGLNVYFGSTRGGSAPAAQPAPPVLSKVTSRAPVVQAEERIVFFHEDAQGGITTVMESPRVDGGPARKVKILFTNGKFQGEDDRIGESAAQIGFSLVPCALTDRFDRALLIGLGTGHSAIALKWFGFREVDVAELAAGISQAAGTEFAELNQRVLEDPTVRLYIEDGRNLLLANPKERYDLVTIEISSVWFSGSTNLYSKEFFELVKSRLTPKGVLQQWIQIHHIGPKEIASAIATARAVFPHVSFWHFGGQGMIVASNAEQQIPAGRLEHLDALLRKHAAGYPEPIRQLVLSLNDARLMSPAAVERMITQLQPVVNTDHNRWIEYATPRYNAGDYDWRAHNLALFAGFDKQLAGGSF